jgi:hypothetical protein
MAVLKYYDGSNWEPVVSALQGPTGPTGATSPTGATGATGVAVGLPTGGATGTVLVKTSNADYATAWATAGKVLQVVSATTTTSTGTSSTSFQDSGLSVSITPSATSSKVLIIVSQAIGAYSANNDRVMVAHQLVRGSTAIFGNASANYGPIILVDSAALGLLEYGYNYATSFLDSPSTTSSTTYKTQIRCNTATSITAQANSYESSIIAMEIGA